MAAPFTPLATPTHGCAPRPVPPLEFLPQQGLGAMRFGMRPAEVEAVFAEPEVYEDWMGGNRNDALLRRGLILSFDQCDAWGPLPHARLCGLDVWFAHRPELTFWGEAFGRWTAVRLLERAAAHGLADLRPLGPNALHSFAGAFQVAFDADGHAEWLSAWAAPNASARPMAAI